MKNIRIMSYDFDSFTLVRDKKSKFDRVSKVLDTIRGLDVDMAFLQGDENLLYNVLGREEEYQVFTDYTYNMILAKDKVDCLECCTNVFCGSYITNLDDELIAFYNIKKYKKESMYELRKMLEEDSNIKNMILAGAFKNVNIDDFCNKYNLNNIRRGPKDNYILASKGLEVKVADRPKVYALEGKSMIVDITHKKSR